MDEEKNTPGINACMAKPIQTPFTCRVFTFLFRLFGIQTQTRYFNISNPCQQIANVKPAHKQYERIDGRRENHLYGGLSSYLSITNIQNKVWPTSNRTIVPTKVLM